MKVFRIHARLSLICCLAALVLAGGAAVTVSRLRTGHRPGGVIAVAATPLTGDSGAHIYLIDPRTGRWRQLTAGPGDDYGPVWSRGGERLAFWSLRQGGYAEAYVIDRKGDEEHRLTTSDYNKRDLAWSRQGDALLYIAERATAQGPVEELILHPLTGAPVSICSGPGLALPSMSPLEDTIAVLALVAGTWQMYTLQPSTAPACPVMFDNVVWSQRWSPTDRLLALQVGRTGSKPHFDIGLLDPAAGTVRPLTGEPTDEVDPVWSPDGTAVAYLAHPADSDGPSSLCLAFLDGRKSITLVPPGTLRGASWSPCGGYLVYLQEDYDGVTDAWVIEAKAGALPRRLPRKGNIWDAAWSPK